MCIFTLQHRLHPHLGSAPILCPPALKPLHPTAVSSVLSHTVVSDPLRPVACQAPLSLGFWRQEYRGGCHDLLPGIFPSWGSNPGLLHLLHHGWVLYPLSHQGSPTEGRLNTKLRPGSWDLQCPKDHMLFRPCSFRQLQPQHLSSHHGRQGRGWQNLASTGAQLARRCLHGHAAACPLPVSSADGLFIRVADFSLDEFPAQDEGERKTVAGPSLAVGPSLAPFHRWGRSMERMREWLDPPRPAEGQGASL